jgi:hypothetical protein
LPRIPLDITPGSGRRATANASRGGWWDMSLVRWDADQLKPVGGWKRLPGLQLGGEVRNLLSWRDNEALRWVAAATLGEVRVWDGATSYGLTPPDFVSGVPAGLLDGSCNGRPRCR